MNRIMGRRQFFGSIARVVRQVAGVMLGGWMAVGSANTNWPPPDGWVVTQGDQGGIFVIDAAKGSILRALPTAFSERGEGGTLAPASETIASVNRQLLAISRPNSGIRVWDVSLNRIVWSHAEARAVGFLGADGRRLAVLVRAPGASMTEFAVWDLHDELVKEKEAVCALQTRYGIEQINSFCNGRIVGIERKQGEMVRKGDVIAYIEQN